MRGSCSACRRCLMLVSFTQPLVVVALLELDERALQLLDRLEGAHPEELLLQRADEALSDAVALRLSYEGRA